jgi:glyoxylase-like metal-dependent hydrolase (beta-lactamase superfamily II)
MILGDYQIDMVLDGHFWLDAGSIFGVVPRTIWEKRVHVDERHRMRLAVRCLLVRDGKRTILIDSGQGNKQNEKFRDRYTVEQPFTLLDNLAKLGVKPEDVTDVVNCHLHFDHAGWNTIREGGKPDGAVIPTFPNARYWSQRAEWERAQVYRTQRDAGSFLPEDFIPLEGRREAHHQGHGAAGAAGPFARHAGSAHPRRR